jgi:hypothetical protein
MHKHDIIVAAARGLRTETNNKKKDSANPNEDTDTPTRSCPYKLPYLFNCKAVSACFRSSIAQTSADEAAQTGLT